MAVAGIPLIFTGLLALLVLFMLVGWVINLIFKKKIINGAKLYLFLISILFLVHVTTAATSAEILSLISEYPIQIILMIAMLIGVYLIPALIALFLMRRFNKKNNLVSNANS
jgi:hypothetical protein